MGTLPPPLGGVSVFIQRRLALLRREGVPCRLVTWTALGYGARLRWLFRVALHPSPARFELNGLETMTMLALLLRPFPAHVAYWLHSGQFSYRLRGVRRWLFRRFLRRVDDLVLVSVHIYPMLAENGFALPAHHRVQNAFLPPDLETEPRILRTYDPETLAFVASRSPLLVMQGSDAFHDGVDRYGSDVGIEMIRHLRKDYPRIGLLIGRPTTGSARYQTYFDSLLDHIQTHDLGDHVHFMTGEKELWPLTRRADVFLRPSNQDGDSVSVREAMLFGVPVVASDACPRPEGVYLFRNRDSVDGARAVREAIGARKGTGQKSPGLVPV